MDDELVAFLLARLDEDEAVARAADSTEWTAATEVGDHANYGVVTAAAASTLQRLDDGSLLTSPGDEVVAFCGRDVGELRARHVGRHDPARVLADVSAKRRIVRTVAPAVLAMDEQISREWDGALRSLDDTADFLLRLLAVPYDTHPDFREAWKV